jgi:hypothetical protein
MDRALVMLGVGAWVLLVWYTVLFLATTMGMIR